MCKAHFQTSTLYISIMSRKGSYAGLEGFPRPQSVLSKKALRLDRLKQAKEQRCRVKRITKRLYEVRRPPSDIAEHREVQGKVGNLRQVTRLVKAQQAGFGISTIHQMSLSMIEDIKGARVARDSLLMEEEDVRIDRQQSLPQLPSRGKSHTSNSSSGSQLHALTMKMEQLLQHNTSNMAETEKREAAKRQRHTLVGGVGSLITKALRNPGRDLHQHSFHFPRTEAELVQFQLKRDVKRLETKQRLLVSSVLILEDDFKACAGVSVVDKRKLLEKRINSVYVLLDFYKQTMTLAVDYLQRIDEVMYGNTEEIPKEKLAALAHEVQAMVQRGKALDYIAESVQAKARPLITKKELVKYQQVTMAQVVPRILDAASKSFDT